MKTIALIHGTADCAANWQDWGRWLEERGWRVIAVDLPGHALEAQADADSSVAACADHLAPLLAEYRPLVLLGHSLGANVAIELALRQIAPLSRLLLVCPAVDIPPVTSQFYEWFVGQPLELLYAQRGWLVPLIASFPRAATAARIAPAVIRRTWCSLRDWQPPDWQQLRVRTEIAGGLWDPIAPPSALRTLRDSLPDAGLTLLPCRHLPMDSDPVGFARWLQNGLPNL
ncbi:alpha/beta fold hydrolase [Gloeobacter kilaueensis]|uniref:Alpha/beta hydrolase fold protein n=1 Tax=Gloeobacter kilaueensis (strain ATCC BAA-2537 / CCAP 1431/1 / ULC 316 / JS1) TaxID=1183438 RepID=U5QS37_GLOK1|nr:alpha/beta fold hydrolase [Gloeobacter kilaueensis]AGY60510.1 alpha/beta hydrolase fold protein [Gloeobacter kilaueensis JS1]